MSPKVALYLRQSRDMEEGIERQRTRCTALATARGWEIVRTFEDNDVSATKPRGPGTAWASLLTAITNGEVEIVVSLDMDRLLRTVKDLVTLGEAGARVLTVDGEIDLTTADGEFRATMLAGIARFEGRRKSERQIRANEQRNEAGVFWQGGVRLSGYTMTGEVIEEEAVIVRRIFDRFTGGDTLRGIARELSADGIPSRRLPSSRPGPNPTDGRKPHRQPSAWPSSSVRSILTNPRYAGRAARAGAATGAAGTWVPLIDPDIFDAVQAKLSDPARRTNGGETGRQHLGSGVGSFAPCRRNRFLRCRDVAGARDGPRDLGFGCIMVVSSDPVVGLAGPNLDSCRQQSLSQLVALLRA